MFFFPFPSSLPFYYCTISLSLFLKIKTNIIRQPFFFFFVAVIVFPPFIDIFLSDWLPEAFVVTVTCLWIIVIRIIFRVSNRTFDVGVWYCRHICHISLTDRWTVSRYVATSCWYGTFMQFSFMFAAMHWLNGCPIHVAFPWWRRFRAIPYVGQTSFATYSIIDPIFVLIVF